MKVSRLIAGALVLATTAAAGAYVQRGAPFADGRFENSTGAQSADMGGAVKAMVFSKQVDKRPDAPIPLRQLSAAELETEVGPLLYRLGHSTILMKLDGHFVLTDPVFSKRA